MLFELYNNNNDDNNSNNLLILLSQLVELNKRIDGV